jgi:hypothetical protein
VLILILIILLILLLIGALPRWQYAKDWGYAPSILIGLVLVIRSGRTCNTQYPSFDKRGGALRWR